MSTEELDARIAENREWIDSITSEAAQHVGDPRYSVMAIGLIQHFNKRIARLEAKRGES